ncbi:MAG: hypothetical protein IT244_00705 [Bacteroidia bacterium]|nr:hypothetical protein [Bacteroidia bacterium]
MNRIKLLFTLVLALTASVLSAQDKIFLAARKAYNAGQFAKAQSTAQKALEKDKTQAEWWYLRACSEFQMSKMTKYMGGKVAYDKEAVKSAVRARQYDPDGTYYDEYATVFGEIVDKNNKEAMANYAGKRYAKAVQMYHNSFELTGDTIAYGMMGLSYWEDKKELDGLRVFREITQWNNGAKKEGWGEKTFMREPFEILSNYFLKKGMFDSAILYTEMGLGIYNLNKILLENEKFMLKTVLIDLGKYQLDENFRLTVNRGLKYFPNDSQFLYQQNYYYLTRLMGATQTRPYDSADKLLYGFFADKNAMMKKGVNNGSDEFLIKDTAKFLFQCLDYYLRTNTRNTTAYVFKEWYKKYNRIAEYDVTLAESLLKNPPANISKRMITMLFSDAVAEFPWNKNIKKYRLAYFNNWMKKPKRKGELVNLLEMNEELIADFPADKTLTTALQSNLLAVLDSTIADGKMYDAWTYYYRVSGQFPASPSLPSLKQKLAAMDFKKRYSETRIAYTEVKGKKIANTGWNGESAMCRPGQLPDTTLYKVLHRINYFRQNAGIVLPMNLSYDRVLKCQEAAVMYNGKGIFTREPTPETHQCFTEDAKEAAAVAQAILENNPAQCVTIFMDDSKSVEVVNRMSILNPEALDMGFGSAENNSVFWLLDVGGAPDSVYYQSHFVAWPPEGTCPKMLMFKKWTFSIAADVTGAKVTIKSKDGSEVANTVSQYTLPGMLLKTLIIQPNLDPKKLTEKDGFEVTVELKDKRKFTYKIQLI